MKRPFPSVLAAVCAFVTTGCSQASETPEQREQALVSVPAAAPVAEPAGAKPAAPPPSTPSADASENVSRVLGKKGITLRGAPACEVRFAYAGRPAETLIREESCPAVTAKMVTQQELEALDRWSRLDGFARKFVAALPGGKVLYVEGGFSASVYPVGTTGSTYEVPVAD